MITKTLTAAVAVAALSGSAMADLIGTTLDLELNQSGFVGNLVGPTGGLHTYGTIETFTGPGAGDKTWDAMSPAGYPGYDNSILIDFTNFQLPAFYALGPSTGTMDITNIAEEVAIGSVDAYLPTNPGVSVALSASAAGNSLSVSWDAETVYMGNPVVPSVVVVWNSIPAPGSLALLGLAGITASRRRRRRD
ncbi:MAG: PEP-CTERM sorting domain-containing protein [Phycisphaerales bacterium]|nr:MAG: PEP-CTERM sorting domain-containing protein [Phycisphaerales bacterium]